jgi:hypothetical protein
LRRFISSCKPSASVISLATSSSSTRVLSLASLSFSLSDSEQSHVRVRDRRRALRTIRGTMLRKCSCHTISAGVVAATAELLQRSSTHTHSHAMPMRRSMCTRHTRIHARNTCCCDRVAAPASICEVSYSSSIMTHVVLRTYIQQYEDTNVAV